MRAPLAVRDLGLFGYAAALAEQEALLDAVAAGRSPSTLLLVEHPAVITVGRGLQPGARAAVGLAADERAPPAPTLPPGTPRFEVARGGGLTWHGPGQVVGYPIIRLARRDLRAYLRALEGGLVAALAALGLAAQAIDGATGVWTRTAPPRKLASIGVGCRRFTTWHGFALNVATDLAVFRGLDPCGFPAEVMTTVEREVGRAVPIAEAKHALVAALVPALEALAE